MFVVVGTFDHDQGKSSSIGRQGISETNRVTRPSISRALIPLGNFFAQEFKEAFVILLVKII